MSEVTDLHDLLKHNRRQTVLILVLVAILCPILYFTVDLAAAQYAKNELSKTVVNVARKTDNFDDFIMMGCVVAALIAWFRSKNLPLAKKLVFPPAASLLTGIPTHILKALLGRWRPKGYFKYGEFGFEFFAPFKSIMASFPSGHSSSIMAIMTAMAIMKPRYRIAFYAFAVVLASSRIIVGAHYPSDVVGGLALGYLFTRWLHYWFLKKNWYPAAD